MAAGGAGRGEQERAKCGLPRLAVLSSSARTLRLMLFTVPSKNIASQSYEESAIFAFIKINPKFFYKSVKKLRVNVLNSIKENEYFIVLCSMLMWPWLDKAHTIHFLH